MPPATSTSCRLRRAALALASACGPAPAESPELPELAAELAAIAEVEAHDEAELTVLLARGTLLSARARQIVQLWQAHQRSFDQARATYAASATIARGASAEYGTAIEDFRHAEQQYRRAALVVILAAASSGLCSTTASTRAFRARLRAEGVELDGQDIDHIWPKSLGGVDHPLNYQVLDSSLNRSLGAGVLEKFMTQPLAVVQGLAVSALSSLSC